jgi:hypothetical protein
MSRLLAACVATFLLATAAAGAARAQGTVVIYRCTDAAGGVTLQNGTPCPKGSKQEVRRMTAPPPAPPPPAFVAPAPVAAPPAQPAPTPAAETPTSRVLQPPTPLFACRKWNGDEYLGDTGEPPSECVPLDVRGIDGSQALAAGQACEMRRDDCTAVPAEQLCTAWKRRVDEAEFRAKFAPRDAARQAEFARVRDAWLASTCAQ